MAKEEKLEEAKRLYKDANADQRYVLESLFPELAEIEEVRIRKEIISAINIYCSEYLRGAKVRNDMLAWLEKQAKQNLVWSEEDEEMWLDAIKYLELFDAQGIHGNKAVPCINWLKSLKPQNKWKPSKDQIGALNYAYCELFKREDVGHNVLGPLQKLCDELKKL